VLAAAAEQGLDLPGGGGQLACRVGRDRLVCLRVDLVNEIGLGAPRSPSGTQSFKTHPTVWTRTQYEPHNKTLGCVSHQAGPMCRTSSGARQDRRIQDRRIRQHSLSD
jgi:hypothetical protein